ncbi:MAG: peptidoglycan DD-metalloendopeptidase family protein [Microbacterium sp.]|nr:peptidoglycan DD-metalloendopeptidase family protein [Microbacterium sp.]
MARMRHAARAALVAVLALGLSGVLTGTFGAGIPAASAKEYPDWEDVEQARENTAAKKAEIARLQNYIAELERQLDAAQREAEKAGTAYQIAQQRYDEAALEADRLKKSADRANRDAERSARSAGLIAAQRMRMSGGDPTMQLLTSGQGVDDMLYYLGTADQLSQQSAAVFDQAVIDRNSASALQSEAELAERTRAELAAERERAFEKARAAQQHAQELVQANRGAYERMQSQLAYLQRTEEQVEDEWQERLDANGDYPGEISSAGWARPVLNSYISSDFGPRIRSDGSYSYHAGIDLAGLACYTPIYAAASGTVQYAGWYGGYGNAVIIDHGEGITTLYAHQPDGGIKVQLGAHVQVGQQIGQIGNTGRSEGCHLHFETRVGGAASDPEPFMSQRGITLP